MKRKHNEWILHATPYELRECMPDILTLVIQHNIQIYLDDYNNIRVIAPIESSIESVVEAFDNMGLGLEVTYV